MRTNRTSCTIARDRLEHLLLSEKLQVSPEALAQMKRELRAVIRRYVSLEHTRLNVQIQLISETKQGEEHVKTIQIKGL
ncbi:putative cell division topological specificity factor MinE [Marvinbryantia formatexigens DSM 14469]|uniref:Cell division topological specificity factor MinE n=1 Tax=Marvinbryantia formatexigens DSM 14469 TaxID=478749 RepID=C6LCB2_9FIRM|nr:cell division topological specificity factor MinE [Marvinbryantia formatexigens]EET61576.1 putative cell division topological specificity factor MinE [Marvinbryantia formatexigens DSM 14469]UWO24593.1 cell division topological specificity factor MinE [Marvinbryantia formatexigens DSM 14469]SDF14731.1 cell division topological specificity factor MinE [Marvinbryantia formatexigens]